MQSAKTMQRSAKLRLPSILSQLPIAIVQLRNIGVPEVGFYLTKPRLLLRQAEAERSALASQSTLTS
jgi:hypothetical protein